MEFVDLVIWGAAAIIIGIHQLRRLDRRVKKHPRIAIRDLREDLRGHIRGVVKMLDDQQIEAGLTGRSCVYYRARVENSIAGERGMSTVIDEGIGVPFVVDDGTGRAVIDPRNAEVELVFDVWSQHDTFYGPTPRTDALLARHGYTSPDPLWKRRLRCGEGIVVAGDTISVVGAGVREADPLTIGEGLFREAGTRLHLAGSEKSPLWIVKGRGGT